MTARNSNAPAFVFYTSYYTRQFFYFPIFGKRLTKIGFHCAVTYSIIFVAEIPTATNWICAKTPEPNRLLYVTIANWAIEMLYENALQVSTIVSIALFVSFPTLGVVAVAVVQVGLRIGEDGKSERACE